MLTLSNIYTLLQLLFSLDCVDDNTCSNTELAVFQCERLKVNPNSFTLATSLETSFKYDGNA